MSTLLFNILWEEVKGRDSDAGLTHSVGEGKAVSLSLMANLVNYK